MLSLIHILPGRNGLDLNLTRVNSTINTGEETPLMMNAATSVYSTTKYFYSVTGYANITVKYREPLANGSYEQTFSSAKIVFRPYVEKIGFKTDYAIAGINALSNDRALLEDNRMPNNMFYGNTKSEAKTKADAAVLAAYEGKYDKTYSFGESSKLSYIRFTIVDDSDITYSNYEGAYVIQALRDGSDRYVVTIDDYTLTDKYFDIGLGWEFDFPYIERKMCIRDRGKTDFNVGRDG